MNMIPAIGPTKASGCNFRGPGKGVTQHSCCSGALFMAFFRYRWPITAWQ